jgi:hypothetical protein
VHRLLDASQSRISRSGISSGPRFQSPSNTHTHIVSSIYTSVTELRNDQTLSSILWKQIFCNLFVAYQTYVRWDPHKIKINSIPQWVATYLHTFVHLQMSSMRYFPGQQSFNWIQTVRQYQAFSWKFNDVYLMCCNATNETVSSAMRILAVIEIV